MTRITGCRKATAFNLRTAAESSQSKPGNSDTNRARAAELRAKLNEVERQKGDPTNENAGVASQRKRPFRTDGDASQASGIEPTCG